MAEDKSAPRLYVAAPLAAGGAVAASETQSHYLLNVMRRGAGDTVVLFNGQDGEWQAGHIDGALHIPLHRLESRLKEIPAGRPIAVHCASGYRSAIAASLLAAKGFAGLCDLAGGMNAWESEGLKTVR